MDKATAIASLREALGKGADVVLAATSRGMEYHDRTCTYAGLSRACAHARTKREPPPAWTAALAQADEALRKLAAWAKPGGKDYRAERCRFGPASAESAAGDLRDAIEELAAFFPFRLPTHSSGQQLARWHLVALDPDTTLECWLYAVDHGYWGRFPWAPLVRWWYDEVPVDIDAVNDRPDPVMAAPLIMVDQKSRQARLFSAPARLRHLPDGQGYLPGFAPGEEWGPKLPVLPLALYDLGQHVVERAGRGAPLALRLFIECVLNVPLNCRGAPTGVLLPAMRLKDMLPWLYGEKALQRYRPSTYWPRLHKAFRALESDEARIPFEDPKTGYGGALRIVTPVVIPREGRLNDWVRFSVHLPPGSDKGPLIDRVAMRKAGVISAPAYRMALSLSFLWYDPGRLRVPYGKQHWGQTRQEGRYPPIHDEDLAWMAYPAGYDIGITDGTWRKRLYEARKALKFLETIGFAKTIRGGGIMPGDSWTGWGDQETVTPSRVPETLRINR